MRRLDPRIHVPEQIPTQVVDGRIKSGHDELCLKNFLEG